MKVQQATMVNIWFGTYSFEEWPCEIRIDGSDIVVSYMEEEDSEHIIYSGKEIGSGHYRLECREKSAIASLHCFPDSTIYEGYWKEEGEEGMWRIKVNTVSI